MANDNHASYTKVGFTIVAGFAAVVAALVYFGGCGRRGGEFLAETYYDASVSGLSVGSEVNFRGVKVGQVKSIGFIGADYPEASEADRRKIRIVLSFNGKLARTRAGFSPIDAMKAYVKRGMRATVSPSGITGLSKIELNFPAEASEPEKTSWATEYFCIPPAPSMLEGFADSATKIMNQLKDMDFAAVCSNLASVVESSARTVEEIRTLVETERPAVSAAIGNIEAASRAAKEFLEEVRDEPSLLLRTREFTPVPETH